MITLNVDCQGRLNTLSFHESWKQTLQVGQNTNWKHQCLTTWVRSSSNNCGLKQCSASLIINLEQNPISAWSKRQFMQSSRTSLLIVTASPAEVIKLLIKWAVWSESSDQMVKAQRRKTPACIRQRSKVLFIFLPLETGTQSLHIMVQRSKPAGNPALNGIQTCQVKCKLICLTRVKT